MIKSNYYQHQKTVATKINAESYNEFQRITDKFGLKRYKLLQIVIDTYIKIFSTETYISDYIRDVISTFGQFRLAKDTFALCKTTTNMLCFNKCIALIEEKGKANPQAVLLRTPGNSEDDVVMNRNNDEILKAVLLALNPDLIKELQEIKKAYEVNTLCDALRIAVNEVSEGSANSIEAEIRELFADNERSEYGKVIDTSVGRYKRKYHKSVECFDYS